MTSALRRPTLLWLLALALVSALTAVLSPSPPARAFKPYTHVVTAWSAYGDVVDDGRVTIDGRHYIVDGRVVAALQRWPAHYQAGVVGPDGFPDLTYGQSVIHPEDTGQWLRYLLAKAWQAQSSKAYSVAEKGQILAFAYGFLTHVAGDVWSHTLVNDFSSGIFPGLKELRGKVGKIAIAVRHIIIEGYIGDATPGFDGNPDRTQVGSDVSDDSTTAIALAAPHRFLYDTLVDPRQELPIGNGRGPLIDYFLDLQSDLQLRTALLRRDEKHRDCVSWDPHCKRREVTVHVDTVRGPRQGKVVLMNCEGATIGCVANALDVAQDKSLTMWSRSYVEAWADDIERGLRHWSELGLAISRGLFDPQARRNYQNLTCAKYGAETAAARESCEDGVTVKDVVMHEVEPFLLNHLLPMMGLPDFSKTVIKILQAFSDVIDKLVGVALNPLRMGIEELRKKARTYINDVVKRTFGVDLQMIGSFLDHPSYWMNVDKVALDTPMGRVTVPLFPPGTRDRLDALMGLTPDDHRSTSIRLPDGQVVTASVLKDTAVARNFAIMDNATTMSKLLLLEGTQLSQLATDVLQTRGVLRPTAQVSTYPYSGGVPRNIMTSALVDGVAHATETWLRTADGDHNWRENGQPRFPTNSDGEVHGGYGNFPLWESCVLRPVFRTLFRDWEHGSAVFPDDGDAVAYDATDPKAPTLKLQFLSPTVLKLDPFRPAQSALFVGPGPGLQAVAIDAVYTDAAVSTKWTRTWSGVGEGGISQGTGTGGTVPISAGGTDGTYSVRVRAYDPCHQGSSGRSATRSYVLDLTGPSVTVTEPAAGQLVDSDDLVRVRWETDDGTGVGSDLADGIAFLGSTNAGYDERLDMFLQLPGPQTIDVYQPDELGNNGAGESYVELHATSESLRNNVERGRQQQMIPDEGLYQYLAETLDAAVADHARGDHASERSWLEQVASVLGQQPQGIDPMLREVLLALVEDLRSIH